MVIVVVLFLGLSLSHIGSTNQGQHTGYISAVEKSGLIWKTWRAYVKTDPQSSQEDDYCVEDDAIVSALQSAQESRKIVTVSYSLPRLVFKWQCGGESSIIRSIQ